MLEGFDKDSKAIKSSLIKMCWFMRGGISMDEIYHMGYNDRELINKMIEENLDITKESGMPFF